MNKNFGSIVQFSLKQANSFRQFFIIQRTKFRAIEINRNSSEQIRTECDSTRSVEQNFGVERSLGVSYTSLDRIEWQLLLIDNSEESIYHYFYATEVQTFTSFRTPPNLSQNPNSNSSSELQSFYKLQLFSSE